MGFFVLGTVNTPSLKLGGIRVDTLHQHECKACPLDKADVRHGKMLPTGSDHPDVYIIGEAPGADEDRRGEQFVGLAGRTLRARIPRDFEKDIRWNNTIRTRPPNNRDPDPIEIEACRPSIERDIAKTAPKAIFAMGGVPLKWALKRTGFRNWRGRRIPVCIAGHNCWLFPMYHPSFVNRMRHQRSGPEIEGVFNRDLARAFAQVDRLPPPEVHTPEMAGAGVEIVAGGDMTQAKRVVDFLRTARKIGLTGLDFETNCLRPYEKGARILTVAVATVGRTMAFVLDHPKARWSLYAAEAVRRAFVEYLEDPDVVRAVHHLPFELEWIAFFFGRRLLRRGTFHCTLSQAAILDERVGDGKGSGCLSLGFLTIQNFGIDIKALSTLDRKSLVNEPVDAVLRYNAIDAKYHLLLHLAQMARLTEDALLPVYQSHRRRLATVVLTQAKGVLVDQDESRRLADKYQDKIDDVAEAIAGMAIVRKFEQGERAAFNPSSPKQVNTLLQKYLKTEVGYDKKTDAYHATEAVLVQLDHPVAQAIIDYRHFVKVKSTYIDPFRTQKPRGSLFPDGLIHCVLNTNFAETGRSSAEDPNTQNVIKHDEASVEVRKQIIAAPGHKLVAFDYGQIQARLIACHSKDARLVQSFYDDYDIHKDWAEWFAAEYPSIIGGRKFASDKDVMKKLRQQAKSRFVFACFFGAQEYTISQGMEVPEIIAKRALREFWDQYPGIRRWHEDLEAAYREHGYVEALSGRRRRAPLDRNRIINSPIQADESEIVFEAFAALSERGHWHLQPILEVHDDLVFMLPDNRIDSYSEIIISDMLDIPFKWINVPLVVEQSIGENWLEMREVGKYRSDRWFTGNP